MATIVKDIYDSIHTLTAAELPTYKKMRNVFAPETNTERDARTAYGVLHGAADNAQTVTRTYTLDHTFTVLLMNSFVRRQDDEEIQATINDLYDQADKLLVKFFLSKLALPAIVLNVDSPAISEPEILENETVLLRVSFNVKYRNVIA